MFSKSERTSELQLATMVNIQYYVVPLGLSEPQLREDMDS